MFNAEQCKILHFCRRNEKRLHRPEGTILRIVRSWCLCVWFVEGGRHADIVVRNTYKILGFANRVVCTRTSRAWSVDVLKVLVKVQIDLQKLFQGRRTLVPCMD